jgi:hypothetical protein
MEKVYKHITIYQAEDTYFDKPVYGVMNTKHGDLLGYIAWEPNWKQFIFSANKEDDIIFSVSCLKDIIDFIENEIK